LIFVLLSVPDIFNHALFYCVNFSLFQSRNEKERQESRY
jgi:hypothetical protein